MTETSSAERVAFQRALNVLLRSGYMLFSLAIIALGVETYLCTGSLAGTLIQTDRSGRLFPDLGGLRLGSFLQAHGANGRDGAGRSAVRIHLGLRSAALRHEPA